MLHAFSLVHAYTNINQKDLQALAIGVTVGARSGISKFAYLGT